MARTAKKWCSIRNFAEFKGREIVCREIVLTHLAGGLCSAALFSGIEPSVASVHAALGGATEDMIESCARLVPPATTRAGTAQAHRPYRIGTPSAASLAREDF
jgi:hypothetical protein